MWWFRAEFVGRDEMLNSVKKPSTFSLSPIQISRVVAFARKHYQCIDIIVVHKLTEKTLGVVHL